MSTRIDAHGDQHPGNITQSACIPQTDFRIGTERNTGLLIRLGKTEVPALCAPKRQIDVLENAPMGLDLSGGGAAKAKERLFFGRKKWTSFQRSIF